VKQLVVYLNSISVGVLTQDNSGRLAFGYGADWLAKPGAIPLSRSLPLQPEPFEGNRLIPFLAGILPDAAPRDKIARILGVSAGNDFAILEKIGGECAGAISFLPEGSRPPRPGETRVRELDEKELEAIIGELPRRPLLAGESGVRLSLAGAQDKLPVVIRDGRIGLPLGNTPSTHIIKPDSDQYPRLADNEVFCMQLAKDVRLNVSAVTTRRIGKTTCIIATRYDRVTAEDGTVTRIHQEDFCQALSVHPNNKYQEDGGPLVRNCIEMLREWSTNPARDVADFVDALIFNIVIGNADAHGKNYSLLYDGEQRRLAPLYDLVCTRAWSQLSKTPAMKIGKSPSIDTITAEHWKAMAKESHLSWPRLEERLAALTSNILVALDKRSAQQGDKQHPAVANAVATLEKRARLIQRRGFSR
jgi:serine/threonine-protein kinase HipA